MKTFCILYKEKFYPHPLSLLKSPPPLLPPTLSTLKILEMFEKNKNTKVSWPWVWLNCCSSVVLCNTRPAIWDDACACLHIVGANCARRCRCASRDAHPVLEEVDTMNHFARDFVYIYTFGYLCGKALWVFLQISKPRAPKEAQKYLFRIRD